MLNKLTAFLREYSLVSPGDTVIVALSGGSDSVALTFGLYLLREKLGITLEAAHFNHHLRGKESDEDEAFVRAFCDRYDIPLHLGGGQVVPGEKGLEAAAREARYVFLRALPGVVATAHTADDNAETVLMHLIRGTALKGLGGIGPRNGNVIRPLLGATRQDVEDFLTEYCLPHREDSSNHGDAFLRNRIRHHVMPLLRQENPKFTENTSQMALLLRREEALLSELVPQTLPDVAALRTMDPGLRFRCLERFLKEAGVPEPELSHIRLAEKLVFSEKPSASARFPGGITIARCYGQLRVLPSEAPLPARTLSDGLELPELGLRVRVEQSGTLCSGPEGFSVVPVGTMVVRPRETGDRITLNGGTQTLKKLFINKKIPASQRGRIPVIADDLGVLGVYGIGANLERLAKEIPAVTIRFENTEGSK